MISEMWKEIVTEAETVIKREPFLSGFYNMTVIQHDNLFRALSFYLAGKLESSCLSISELQIIFINAVNGSEAVKTSIEQDLRAFRHRDPASGGFLNVFLNYKGFHALESYRVANSLWMAGRPEMAHLLQSLISEKYGVDIHPAAKIGNGIFLDHATGIVIGETAVVGNDVSILQEVTLGGTGKESGDRHPKIGSGVLIGAGAKLLGNIKVGDGAKIGAGSVVLKDVPEHVTVVGIPARVAGKPRNENPSLEMDQNIEEN